MLDIIDMDVIDIVLGLLLFILGLWLNRKQERFIVRLDTLQEALAQLELREKITIIQSNAKRFQQEPLKHDEDKVRLLIGDCTAGLALFEFASPEMRHEYADVFYEAYQSLDEQFISNGKDFQEVLVSNLAKHAAGILQKGKPEIAVELENLINKRIRSQSDEMKKQN